MLFLTHVIDFLILIDYNNGKTKTLLRNTFLTYLLLYVQLALANALRYFPPDLHSTLAVEFAEELRSYGHIYMYRFLPDIEMRSGVQ